MYDIYFNIYKYFIKYKIQTSQILGRNGVIIELGEKHKIIMISCTPHL